MKHPVRTVAVTLLAAGLMALFLRNANAGRIWSEMRGARGELLLAAAACTLAVDLLRAVRWRELVRPTGYARLFPALRATVIGFAVNSLVPGRVGEVVRPVLLARSERLSTAALLATVVVERLLDLLVICLLLAAVATLGGMPLAAAGGSPLRTGALLGGAAGLGVLAVALALAADPRRAGSLALRLLRWAPASLSRRLSGGVERFHAGAAAACRPRPLTVGLLWTCVLWGATVASVWCVSWAFGIAMDLRGAGIVTGMLVIGVALPTPAGVGGFHAAYQLGVTALYGASAEQAVGAGLVLHLLSFGPVTLIGLLLMAQDGLRLASLRSLSDAAAAVTSAGDATARSRAGPNDRSAS